MAFLQVPTICLIFCIIEPAAPTAINNYGQECRVIRPSKQDTPGTLRQVATENARCRAARAKKKQEP